MIRFFKLFSLTLLFLCSISLATSDITIKVNNKIISSDVTPFIKSGTTYVPIRFVADALAVDSVSWNNDTKSVTIKNSNSTILLFVNKNYAYVNNEYKNLTNNALMINARTFVPIRFVSEVLGANVDWDETHQTILISTKTINHQNNSTPNKKPSSSSTSSSSSNSSSSSPSSNSVTEYEDAIYWLSRIIEAEAGGEPFNGKVAVGEVILNRVKSEEFPDTIWNVIFDKEFGIQFEPVANGTIYNTPSEESIKAAKTALNGSNNVGNCLYFLNPTIASSNWIVKNREYYTTIANHAFYV